MEKYRIVKKRRDGTVVGLLSKGRKRWVRSGLDLKFCEVTYWKGHELITHYESYTAPDYYYELISINPIK